MSIDLTIWAFALYLLIGCFYISHGFIKTKDIKPMAEPLKYLLVSLALVSGPTIASLVVQDSTDPLVQSMSGVFEFAPWFSTFTFLMSMFCCYGAISNAAEKKVNDE